MIMVLLAACLSAPSSNQAAPETLVREGYDQAEMDAAIARARSEVDGFIAELASPTGESHAVKTTVKDTHGVEHFWLLPVTYADGSFTGAINNDPGVVKSVKIGQSLTVSKGEISDWMYMKGGKIHGNYTMRPLLKTMPPEKAAELRALLANP